MRDDEMSNHSASEPGASGLGPIPNLSKGDDDTILRFLHRLPPEKLKDADLRLMDICLVALGDEWPAEPDARDTARAVRAFKRRVAWPAVALARASEMVDRYSVSVSALSDGKIRAVAKVLALKDTSKLGFPTNQIQEYDGSKWVTVRAESGQYGSETDHSYTLYHNGTAGKKYRGRASCSATFGGATERKPLKTSSTTVVGK